MGKQAFRLSKVGLENSVRDGNMLTINFTQFVAVFLYLPISNQNLSKILLYNVRFLPFQDKINWSFILFFNILLL